MFRLNCGPTAYPVACKKLHFLPTVRYRAAELVVPSAENPVLLAPSVMPGGSQNIALYG